MGEKKKVSVYDNKNIMYKYIKWKKMREQINEKKKYIYAKA